MLKQILAITIATVAVGPLAGCADREEGVEGGGGGVVEPMEREGAPGEEDETERDDLREPIGPRGE